MEIPKTIPELIDAFGGPSEFAKVIDKNPSTASEMKRSGSIRVSYWPLIVAAARDRGIPGISLESIAKLHLAGSTGADLEANASPQDAEESAEQDISIRPFPETTPKEAA